MEHEIHRPLSRREALKMLAGLTGATALSSLPNRWSTPFMEVGVLPAFAQCSATDTAAALIVTNKTDGQATVTVDETEGPGHFGLKVGPQAHDCLGGIAPGTYDVCVTIVGGTCARSETCLDPTAFDAGDEFGLEIDCSGQELRPYTRFHPKPDW